MAFSHLDKQNEVNMVDVGEKEVTSRQAMAQALVNMSSDTLALVRDDAFKKGNVIATAKIAGIMAAKQTSTLIPLCHPLMINSVKLEFNLLESESQIEILSTVNVQGKTGVEMEALTAASVAALTIYDMCKSVEKGISITDIQLLEKSGGKSGHWKFNK